MTTMAGIILKQAPQIALLLSLGAGCWQSGRGDTGFVLGPVVYETYEIKGVVRSMGSYRERIADAEVSVITTGTIFAPAITGLDGQFSLDVERKEYEPHVLDTVSLVLYTYQTSGRVVVHNYAAAQGHQHKILTLQVAKLGFKPTYVTVEVPRDLREPPIEIALIPLERLRSLQ